MRKKLHFCIHAISWNAEVEFVGSGTLPCYTYLTLLPLPPPPPKHIFILTQLFLGDCHLLA